MLLPFGHKFIAWYKEPGALPDSMGQASDSGNAKNLYGLKLINC